MRNTFIRTLEGMARHDNRVYVITGDLGYSVLEKFKEDFPKQFINIGVAEQNMIGISAGLASSGKLPYAYSIATFASMRAFEQIRDDVCYQNLPVRIVAIGGGFSYGHLGVTHYGIEDIGIMRALPNMKVFVAGDQAEAEAIAHFSQKDKGPLYIRLGKTGEPRIHGKKVNIKLGKGFKLRGGKDIALIATGPVVVEALRAAEFLAKKKISVGVISMPWVKPVDRSMILGAANSSRAILTIEEHNIISGLGSAVAEVLAYSSKKVPFLRLGVQDKFPNVVGTQDYLRDLVGISAKKIAKSAISLLRRKYK